MSFLAAVGGFAKGLGEGIDKRKEREEKDTTKAENAISSSMNQYYSVAAQRREDNRKKRSVDKTYMQTLRSFDPTLSQEQLVFAASLDETRREQLVKMATSAYMPEGQSLADLITRIESPEELDDPVALQSKEVPTVAGTAETAKLSKPSLSGVDAHQGQYEYIDDTKVSNIYSRISGMYQDAFQMTPEEAKRLAYKTTDDIVRPAFQVNWVDSKAEGAYTKQTRELVIMESNANVLASKSKAITSMRTDMDSVMKAAQEAFVSSDPQYVALGANAKLNPGFLPAFRASKQYKQAEKTLISGAVLEMKKNPQNAGTINSFLNRYMPGRYGGDAIEQVNSGKTAELDPSVYYYLQEAQQEGQPATEITAGVFTGAEIHKLATGEGHPKFTKEASSEEDAVATMEEELPLPGETKEQLTTRQEVNEQLDKDKAVVEDEKTRLEAEVKAAEDEGEEVDPQILEALANIDSELESIQTTRLEVDPLTNPIKVAQNVVAKARGPVEFDTELVDTNPGENKHRQLSTIDRQINQAIREGDAATLEALLSYMQTNIPAKDLSYGLSIKSGRMKNALRKAIADLEE